MQSITIDRNKRLKEESHTGHNRWHPDIAPLIEVDPGEEVVLETRDASDCQIKPGMTVADLTNLDAKVAHPLTGPVYIKGARPGDLLEIEYLDILPQPCGWTRNRPGAGFLRDLFTEPYLAHWEIKDGWATSPQIPGVRIPNGSFMGTAGIAPSRAQLEAWSRREAALVARGGIAFLPDPQDAVPSRGAIAEEGLRTLPPRRATGILPRVTPNAASRPLRWAPPPWCASACRQGKRHATISAGRALRIQGILLPRNGPPRVILLPPWVCPYARTVRRKARI